MDAGLKVLLKLVAKIALVFVTLVIVVKVSGALSLGDIKEWFKASQSFSPAYIAGIVIVLLFIDLLVSVPTLTIVMLAGFYLGGLAGAGASIAGMTLAGLCGYGLSRYFGTGVLRFLVRDRDDVQAARDTFERYGFGMIVLARAVPMLPEVTTCLAGLTGMAFWKFLCAWLLGCVPYALVASYAGSISSVDDPTPALLTALGIYVVLWGSWAVSRWGATRSAD